MEFHVNQSPDAHFSVYRLTFPNGKIYIGCTGQRVQKRWGGCYAKKLKKEMDFYGTQNIKREVICEKLLREAAYNLEKKLIELYDSCNPEIGYNRVTGGENLGCHCSQVFIVNMINRPFVDPEYTRRASMAQRKSASDPAIRKKRGDAIRKYYSVEAHKEFMKKPKPAIRVRCITTGVVYSSMSKAAKANNTSVKGVSRACREKGRYCNGLLWEYA